MSGLFQLLKIENEQRNTYIHIYTYMYAYSKSLFNPKGLQKSTNSVPLFISKRFILSMKYYIIYAIYSMSY